MKTKHLLILTLSLFLALSSFHARAQRQVALYKDCDFNGETQLLEPGEYNLNDTRIRKSGLSSIRIPRGMQVTLFSGRKFGEGDQITLSNDSRCLRDVNWNDKATYLLVEREHRRNWFNEHNTSFEQVSVFEHRDFRGRKMDLRPGSYRAGQLQIGNDVISSLRIPEGWSVIIFEHDNFEGASRSFSGNVNSLPANWKDRTSSMVIYGRGYKEREHDAGRDRFNNNNQAITISPDMVNGIVVYTGCNFKGERSLLKEGWYHSNELGVGDDMISSIRVPDGWMITVYEHNDFRGASKVYYNSENCLSGSWKDKISSIRVSRVR